MKFLSHEGVTTCLMRDFSSTIIYLKYSSILRGVRALKIFNPGAGLVLELVTSQPPGYQPSPPGSKQCFYKEKIFFRKIRIFLYTIR